MPRIVKKNRQDIDPVILYQPSTTEVYIKNGKLKTGVRFPATNPDRKVIILLRFWNTRQDPLVLRVDPDC